MEIKRYSLYNWWVVIVDFGQAVEKKILKPHLKKQSSHLKNEKSLVSHG